MDSVWDLFRVTASRAAGASNTTAASQTVGPAAVQYLRSGAPSAPGSASRQTRPGARVAVRFRAPALCQGLLGAPDLVWGTVLADADQVHLDLPTRVFHPSWAQDALDPDSQGFATRAIVAERSGSVFPMDSSAGAGPSDLLEEVASAVVDAFASRRVCVGGMHDLQRLVDRDGARVRVVAPDGQLRRTARVGFPTRLDDAPEPHAAQLRDFCRHTWHAGAPYGSRSPVDRIPRLPTVAAPAPVGVSVAAPPLQSANPMFAASAPVRVARPPPDRASEQFLPDPVAVADVSSDRDERWSSTRDLYLYADERRVAVWGMIRAIVGEATADDMSPGAVTVAVGSTIAASSALLRTPPSALDFRDPAASRAGSVVAAAVLSLLMDGGVVPCPADTDSVTAVSRGLAKARGGASALEAEVRSVRENVVMRLNPALRAFGDEPSATPDAGQTEPSAGPAAGPRRTDPVRSWAPAAPRRENAMLAIPTITTAVGEVASVAEEALDRADPDIPSPPLVAQILRGDADESSALNGFLTAIKSMIRDRPTAAARALARFRRDEHDPVPPRPAAGAPSVGMAMAEVQSFLSRCAARWDAADVRGFLRDDALGVAISLCAPADRKAIREALGPVVRAAATSEAAPIGPATVAALASYLASAEPPSDALAAQRVDVSHAILAGTLRPPRSDDDAYRAAREHAEALRERGKMQKLRRLQMMSDETRAVFTEARRVAAQSSNQSWDALGTFLSSGGPQADAADDEPMSLEESASLRVSLSAPAVAGDAEDTEDVVDAGALFMEFEQDDDDPDEPAESNDRDP